MITAAAPFKQGNITGSGSLLIWRIVQFIVWLVGLTIFLLLIVYPSAGLLILWNILIPVAPALLVVSAGLWRNICPLATTVLLPRHFNWSKRKKMPALLQSKLQLVAITGLYIIVPMRHALFNTNGTATVILLFVAALIGTVMGFTYDWKSGWCSSLCPVHPVEKLYGSNTITPLPNAHCDQCVKCSVPCPDTTPNFHPALTQKNTYQILSGLLTVGGLPGFIWGWFQVADHAGPSGLSQLLSAYGWPFFGFLGSMMLYIILQALINKKYERTLINCFAAAGVSCYYWFRIPALLGFGHLHKDGLLINMQGVLPGWSLVLMTLSSTVFFFWWLVFRKQKTNSWVVRPEYASRAH
jgi:hypothetical protein